MKWFECGQPETLVRPGAEDLTTVVRSLRHTFLNDLQVIAGWLQIGRSGAALEYLQRVKSRLDVDTRLGRLGSRELEAVILTAKAWAAELGLRLDLVISGPPEASRNLAAAAAAAASDGAGSDWRRAAGPLAGALRAILKPAIRCAAEDGAERIEVVVDALAGPHDGVRLELKIGFPAESAGRLGDDFEAAALRWAGFRECRPDVRPETATGVGVERRPCPDGRLDIVLTSASWAP